MEGQLERSDEVTEQVARLSTSENRSLLILYGSETGNAEEIASELRDMTERLHFYCELGEMDSFKLSDILRFTLVIFVTSTTGQGDMPLNTTKFWKSLRRGKLNNTNCLGRMKCAIFGLGDSSYEKFNWAARKLRVRLLQLGATEFFRCGEADERHENGIDSIYLSWYQDLRKLLLEQFPPPHEPIPNDVLMPPRFSMEFAPPRDGDDSEEPIGMAGNSDKVRFDATKALSAALTHVDRPLSDAEARDVHRNRTEIGFSARENDVWENNSGKSIDSLDKANILTDHRSKYLLEDQLDKQRAFPQELLLPIPNTYECEVESNIRITPASHWQDVRLITLRLSDGPDDASIVPSNIPPGSTIIVYPKNFDEDVNELIDLMEWEPICDRPIRWGYAPKPDSWIIDAHVVRRPAIHAEQDSTLRELLLHNFDFMSVPKRSFIRQLVHFATKPVERERLEELCNMGNEQEFYDYTSRPRRTILELLHDFPSVKIPWERAMDMFPLIRGREFSIANGGSTLDDEEDPLDTMIQIVAALVEYKTIIRKPRQGICSRYLRHLPKGSLIGVTLKVAEKCPLSPAVTSIKRPVIAIATGTGIAPIRAMIHERAWNAPTHQGPVLLFFGCRNKTADYHFRDEWHEYPEVRVVPAFSRDPIEPPETRNGVDPTLQFDPYDASARDTMNLVPKGSYDTKLQVHDYDRGKNYVQYQIRRHAVEICALMPKKPLICICGNSGRMPISVRVALIDALVLGGMVENFQEASRFLHNPANVEWWQETW